MCIRKLLGESLLPLLLLGGALFAIYGWMAPGRNGGNRIVITQGVVDDRVTEYQAWAEHLPSAPDLNNLVEPSVRDEAPNCVVVAFATGNDSLSSGSGLASAPLPPGSEQWRPVALGRSSAPG